MEKHRVSVALAANIDTMPAYNTRSGARAAPADQEIAPGSADNRPAGAVQNSAEVQAEGDPYNAGLTDRNSEVAREHTDTMSQVPTSLKDPSILILRANFNTSHAAVDRSLAEVDKHIQTIEHAKNDTSVPKQMLHDYSTRLDAALTKGDTLVGTLETIHDSLINKLDLLSMTLEEQPALKDPVDAQRSKVRSVFSPYKGAFIEKRRINEHLLSCLFSETPRPDPVPAPSTTMLSQRKDYGYLKPGILSSECTRRELVKFSEDCQIWLKKSLSADDRADTRLVWASIRSVLDEEWTEVLNRNNIANKQFDEIYKIMDRIYLERNPLIVQRLNARRIHKQKEEPVSECLRRIYDAYQSAELKDCPLETISARWKRSPHTY